jgi:hypothetical protein
MRINTLDKLSQRINEEFGVNIFKNTRKREVVDARSVFCHIARHNYNMGLEAIAEYFERNGKPYDHSTAVHAIKMFDVVRRFNPRAEQIVNEVLKDTDQDAYAKYLIEEIVDIADEHDKARIVKILNSVYTRSLEKKKAPL